MEPVRKRYFHDRHIRKIENEALLALEVKLQPYGERGYNQK
ncbi:MULTISPECIES: hypothetical protein [Bacillus cereus group]|nr:MULTISPECIES: hypothetical protein [Bacillus cereus group]WJE22933.1 hypothetical protein QRE65_01310 [Bacillus cereus]